MGQYLTNRECSPSITDIALALIVLGYIITCTLREKISFISRYGFVMWAILVYFLTYQQLFFFDTSATKYPWISSLVSFTRISPYVTCLISNIYPNNWFSFHNTFCSFPFSPVFYNIVSVITISVYLIFYILLQIHMSWFSKSFASLHLMINVSPSYSATFQTYIDIYKSLNVT